MITGSYLTLTRLICTVESVRRWDVVHRKALRCLALDASVADNHRPGGSDVKNGHPKALPPTTILAEGVDRRVAVDLKVDVWPDVGQAAPGAPLRMTE
jgi:hypothetical protein